MRVAVAYNTKDKLHLTAETWRRLFGGNKFDIIWTDASSEKEALDFFELSRQDATQSFAGVKGGADAAIVHSLTRLLEHSARYTHVGLVEQDVLLDEDWFEPTMKLFELGERDGLKVGAVSARSYVDRILIQRDDYAVMHNLGAGMVIFTREAAEIVLTHFRTAWAPDNRAIFSQLSGIDIGRYWAFRGNEQWLSSDWGYDACLASHGFASLALTPARCRMIGQNPPLPEQGLYLVEGPINEFRNDIAFSRYRERLAELRDGSFVIPGYPIIARTAGHYAFFPHQVLNLLGGKLSEAWRLSWHQGFGPFGFKAADDDCLIEFDVFSSCDVILGNGGAFEISDRRSGFSSNANIPEGQQVQISVPGHCAYRPIEVWLKKGAIFHGIVTPHPQPLVGATAFNWHQLPPV